MRYVTVNHLKEGMVLAKTLYGIKGDKLLAQDMVLKDEYIKKIKKIGLAGVYIKDSISDDIIIDEIITPELKHKAIKQIRDLYIDQEQCARIVSYFTRCWQEVYIERYFG